jgi:type II secretion system protein J
MNRTLHTNERAKAFTLIELLIAVTAFAIVLLAMNYVFYGTIHLRNKTTDTIEAALPLQQATSIIKRDLGSIILPGGSLSGELQTAATANRVDGQVSPDFFTADGIVDAAVPWAEVQKVSYLLVDSQNAADGKDLMRAVTRNLLPVVVADQPVQQRLIGGVRSVAFYFYDGTQWRDSWDSATEETKLPQAIKMQIALVSGNKGGPQAAPVEIVVPIAVSASGTQTSQATGGQE